MTIGQFFVTPWVWVSYDYNYHRLQDCLWDVWMDFDEVIYHFEHRPLRSQIWAITAKSIFANFALFLIASMLFKWTVIHVERISVLFHMEQWNVVQDSGWVNQDSGIASPATRPQTMRPAFQHRSPKAPAWLSSLLASGASVAPPEWFNDSCILSHWFRCSPYHCERSERGKRAERAATNRETRHPWGFRFS